MEYSIAVKLHLENQGQGRRIKNAMAFTLVAVIVLVTAGAISAVAFQNYFSNSEVLTTKTITTSTTEEETSSTTSTTSSLQSTTTISTTAAIKYVSLWQALFKAYGANYTNYSSIPGNISISLLLYDITHSNGPIVSGGGNITNVTFSKVTGLPTQPIAEPYPNGVIVDTGGSGNTTSCAMYLLLWYFQVPSTIPYGGATWVGALDDRLYIWPRDISFGMTCPTGNQTTSTMTGIYYP